MKKLNGQAKEVATAVRGRFGMKAHNSRRSQFGWDFIAGMRDMLDRQVERALYGVEWAYKTGRLSADASIAIRDMNCWKFSALLGQVVAAGISQNDIPRFLNQSL